MKTQLKRVASLVCCVCLLATMLAFVVSAESSATISFADTANRTAFSTEQQVWEQNGITVTNNKGASTSNVADYSNPARFYKSSDVVIEYPGMTKLVIDCTGCQDKHVTPWVDSCTDANATATIDGKVVTIVFAEAVDSFSLQTSAQVRAASMTVYTSSSAPEEPEISTDPEANSTLTITEAVTLGTSKDHNTYTDGKYYVTGVITEVYNTQYGNMYIADENGNTITVYGTYSADGSTRYDAMDVKPVAGDTVTVYGIVGQYNGNAQLKNAWITSHTPATPDVDEPDVPDTPADPEADSTLTITEAVELGESKDHNTYTAGKYYVTGVITSVYNTQYGNMYIADENGNTITVYGTYSADGSTRYDSMEVKPVAGDTVTVYGIVGQYNGNAQLKNAWITSHTPAAPDVDEPDTPADPEADSTLTITEAVALGESKDHNTYTAGKYYVSGVITEVYSDVYGNMYIADENGNTITVYGTYSADGSTRYDSMEVKPVAGDTVTVYGIVGQYNGNAQLKNAWITSHTPATPDVDEPDNSVITSVEFRSDVAIVEGNQIFSATLYSVNGSTDLAVEAILEYVTIWYDGTTFAQLAEDTVLEAGVLYDMYVRFNAEKGYTIADVCTVTFVSPSGEVIGEEFSANCSDSQYAVDIFLTPTANEGGEDDADNTLTIEEAIALGESKEHNTYTEEKYYVTGVITSVYNTQYGNMYIADENGNTITVYGTYSADGELRYDAMEVQPVKGDTVTVYGIVGQYNGNAQLKNAWITEIIVGEHDDEPAVDDPEADSTLTIEDAIALGESKDHNCYTENKYYVTGVITEVYNDVYGNMYITDDNGNIITVYGTYSADGELRYDAMEVKPVAGDTITVYGVIGQYNGNAQVKNAWITEHTPGDSEGGNTKPEAGDASNVMIMVVILAISAAAAAVIVKGRNRA